MPVTVRAVRDCIFDDAINVDVVSSENSNADVTKPPLTSVMFG